MHSASSRFNGISLFTGLVLATMCLVNYLHGRYLYSGQAEVVFSVNSFSNFVPGRITDQISFKYSLDAKLASLYTWNLKQLYVYIQTEWHNKVKNLTSRAIVADWILPLPEDMSNLDEDWHIEIQDQRISYNLRDVHKGLAGEQVKVTINVEYMPIVGYFSKTKLYETTITLPSEYSKSPK